MHECTCPFVLFSCVRAFAVAVYRVQRILYQTQTPCAETGNWHSISGRFHKLELDFGVFFD
eukprot:1046667-Rhodomonas_salina.2